MWREAVLPARQGREPLHSAVGGVCRTRHSFRGGSPRTAKHSRFGGAGGVRPLADWGLATGSVGRSGRGGSVYGLESVRDYAHEMLELRVGAVLQLALDLVDAGDHGGVMAAAES